MKFTASRISEGNKIFPAEIHCEPNGLTVKIPGLFSGKSKHLPYNQIGEVSVDTPMVGFSTITFYTMGTAVSAHGFTKDEVNQIKRAIEEGRANQPQFQNSNYGGEQISQKKDSAGSLIVKILFWPIVLILKLTPKLFQFITSDKVTSAVGKGLKGAATANARNKALTLHKELLKVTDDIDILIAQGKKDDAFVLIKKLDHGSSHKLPDSELAYLDYWTNKRKEYISKATN